MKARDRRGFLKMATGAAAVAMNFLYPGITRAGGIGSRWAGTLPVVTSAASGAAGVVKNPDLNQFALGTVVSKTSNGVVLQYKGATRAVRIPSTIAVWKEFDVAPDVIGLNDWLDVKGTPLSDGSLLASSGWVFVNIGRRDGKIATISPTGLTLESTASDPGGRFSAMVFSSKLEVISAKDGSALAGHLTSLTPGTKIGAVGLRLPNDGFRATRIWV